MATTTSLSPSTSTLSASNLGRAMKFCSDNPDHPRCDAIESYYGYDVSLPVNALFLALFSVSALAHLAVLIFHRHSRLFGVVMAGGVVLEVLGYAARVWSDGNQWDEVPFMMQIVCLTLGPALMAAAIYLCLRRIVVAFGAEYSRISPKAYTRLFIPCDVVALLLQAVGGALASVALNNGESTSIGSSVMVTGLSIQSVTLFCFMLTSLDFAFRVRTRRRASGSVATGPSQDPEIVAMRASAFFCEFLSSLAVATVCIFVRSVFRVAELWEDFHGPLARRQDLFIAFESTLVAIAALSINVFHPAWYAKLLFDGTLSKAAGDLPTTNQNEGLDLSLIEADQTKTRA